MQEEFGKFLKKYRETKGLTQEQLAEKADLHVTYISRIERGVRQPTITTLIRISKGLGVKASTLLQEFEKEFS